MRAKVWMLVLVSGCAGLPTVVPAQSAGERRAIVAACRSSFPHGWWAASHSIDAALPLGNNALLIGVTSLQKDGMHYVILSPEGVALFDASLVGGAIKVGRALPPFNRQAFADGLVDDVRSTFLAPAGEPAAVGYGESGAGICRWRSADDTTTDVELLGSKPRWIRNFKGRSLVREVSLSGEPEGGFYPSLLLRVPGMAGYALRMNLISHETPADQQGDQP
jgi:hypothetical protein